MYEFKLYTIRGSKRAEKAIRDFSTLLEDELQGQYSLKVIDILKQPQLAEEDKVFATPTVIKTLPPPVRRIIGDLTDREKILAELNLVPKTEVEPD